MEPKEKQRIISMINDYNAYKSSGGRLYEISVEQDTKTDFICKGVLRLYWDIQRPIVLNKEATSSFVQKRERSSNIVGRPQSVRKRCDSALPATGRPSGVTKMAGDVFDAGTVTDLSPSAKPQQRSRHISPMAKMKMTRTDLAGSASSTSIGSSSSKDKPCRRRSSATDLPSLASLTNSDSSQTRIRHGPLHLPFEFARSGSISSLLRSNSMGSSDKRFRGRQKSNDTTICGRARTKSQIDNSPSQSARSSTSDHSHSRPNLEPNAATNLKTSSSNTSLAATPPRPGTNPSRRERNLSRMITSSFKRPKSMKPIIHQRTAQETSLTQPQVPKTLCGPGLLEPCPGSAPESPVQICPRNVGSTNPKMDVSTALAMATVADSNSISPKQTKKRQSSFRRSFQRSISPKRRTSLLDDAADGEPGGIGGSISEVADVKEILVTSEDGGGSSNGGAMAAPTSTSDTLTVDKAPASASGGRLGLFLSRPRISFRRRRNAPMTNPETTEPSPKSTAPTKSAFEAESLAEFYQPPKGSVTNIRATSNMTVFDIIGATLSKLNAVDEPSRFAIFSIDDTGTVKLIQDDERMLLYRIRLGPKEDVCKLFIMERNTCDAQDFSAEVMQYYHLGMPFLERLVKAYEAEEEREVDRIRIRYADTRRRLEKKLEIASKELFKVEETDDAVITFQATVESPVNDV